MNRDDIIRMAREAAMVRKEGQWGVYFHEVSIPDLMRFAALVAAAEREACLSILRDMEGKKWHTVIHGGEMKGVSLHDAYMAIRARGDK
jgi:hypothetical protein